VTRFVGIGLLICGLVLSGEAFASNPSHHHSLPIKFCYRDNGTPYKPGDYCYTSCAPATACYVEMCFNDGSWMKVFACKQRDCRKVC
jgi:hypothetical protein